ncbi:MAG: redoxin domain-containing protein [Ignavibacteriaceae bacterium]
MFKNKFTILLVLFVAAAGYLIFNGSVKVEVKSNPFDTETVKNFTLKDYNYKAHSLSDYKDSKAIVLMFIATQCPVSNAYNLRMSDLYEKYKGKNIAFVGINSNKAESVSEIKSHAEKNNLKFVILKDEKNKIADELDASVTPEIYVLNSKFEVQYHGRIDDSKSQDNIESKDLENALNEILAGKPISNNRTKAFGCTIKRVED